MITIERVVHAAARMLDVNPDDVMSTRGKREVSFARHLAIAFICQYQPLRSLSSIGRFFGFDHSVVIHARQKIADERDIYPHVDLSYRTLEQHFGVGSTEICPHCEGTGQKKRRSGYNDDPIFRA